MRFLAACVLCGLLLGSPLAAVAADAGPAKPAAPAPPHPAFDFTSPPPEPDDRPNGISLTKYVQTLPGLHHLWSLVATGIKTEVRPDSPGNLTLSFGAGLRRLFRLPDELPYLNCDQLKQISKGECVCGHSPASRNGLSFFLGADWQLAGGDSLSLSAIAALPPFDGGVFVASFQLVWRF